MTDKAGTRDARNGSKGKMTGGQPKANFSVGTTSRGNLYARTVFIAKVASEQGMDQTMVSAVFTVSETIAVGYSAGLTRTSLGAPERMAQLAGNSDEMGIEATRLETSESVPDKPIASVKTNKAPDAGNPVDAVSASLRRAYESTLEESVPDALMDLLRKLE